MRNAALTSIAPTGTISTIAGCSPSIEPLFALLFERHVLDGRTLTEVNGLFIEHAKPAREALAAYIEKERGHDAGPLFRTRTGRSLTIQQIQYILNRIAGQANATLPAKEHIRIHPHLLRHTMLRQVAEEKGERFAREVAGHVSNNYIRLYTMPSPAEQEDAIEDIFG